MYQVAICEDEEFTRDDLRRRCDSLLTGLETPHEITVFATAEDLEAMLSTRAEPFDLLLLDIQLPGKTGVSLAAALRSRDDSVGIIFITGSEAYALEGYKAQPCNYLLKPVSDAALADALRRELKRRYKDQVVSFPDRGRQVRLPAMKIRYVESYDHGINVHTDSEILTFFLPLNQAQELLPPGMFARCHNSYLVNLSQIKTASSSQIVLLSGERLPVGRTYRDSFHRVFIEHFF